MATSHRKKNRYFLKTFIGGKCWKEVNLLAIFTLGKLRITELENNGYD